MGERFCLAHRENFNQRTPNKEVNVIERKKNVITKLLRKMTRKNHFHSHKCD